MTYLAFVNALCFVTSGYIIGYTYRGLVEARKALKRTESAAKWQRVVDHYARNSADVEAARKEMA